MLRMQCKLNIPSRSVKLKMSGVFQKSWMNEVSEDIDENQKFFTDEEIV